MISLNTSLGRLQLPNPILVASGTFGYAREMENLVDLAKLGGIVPKTITLEPRDGNPPRRTAETTAGMLNSIGLDNDGLAEFLEKKLNYLLSLGSPIIVSVAGATREDFVRLAEGLANASDQIAALELNLSCPNVSGGTNYATVPEKCGEIVAAVRGACDFPVLAKLTPNTHALVEVAQAAKEADADALVLTNTCFGMAINWRTRQPMLGNKMGGFSGPAIKPISLRCVYQVAKSVDIPICGVGGITTIDDVMEFFVAGASAVQIGTANFTNPRVTMELIEALPKALREAGVESIAELVGTCD